MNIQHNTLVAGKKKVWRKILFGVLSIPVLSAGLAYLTVSILDGYYKRQAESELDKFFEGRDSLVAKLDYDKNYDYFLYNCVGYHIVPDSILSNASEKDIGFLRNALDGAFLIESYYYREPAYYYYKRVTKDRILLLKDCPDKMAIKADYWNAKDYPNNRDLAEIVSTEVDSCYQRQFLDSVTIASLGTHSWSCLLSDVSISNRYYELTDFTLVDALGGADVLLNKDTITDANYLFSNRYGFFAWYPLGDFGKVYYTREHRASLEINRRPSSKETQYDDFLGAFFVSLFVLVLLSCFFFKKLLCLKKH